MLESPAVDAPLPVARVSRVEVRPAFGELDPQAELVLDSARRHFGRIDAVRCARVYLIEAPLTDAQLQQVADELLADNVNQEPLIAPGSGGSTPEAGAGGTTPGGGSTIEVHYQPGVMDPVAQSTRDAIVEMLGLPPERVQVRTGFRYDLIGLEPASATAENLQQFAGQYLANPVIQDIHLAPFAPESFATGHPYAFAVTHVAIRELDEAALSKLSRDGHLFLSLEEMRAIQDYYREAQREPTDIELETLAQTWSEHCVHKTLKATVHYTEGPGPAPGAIDFTGRPGHTVHADGSVTINNLLKSTIAAATRQLMSEPPHDQWCISVFVDNAGIVRFDDEHAVCIKVETHNHPSAIEPYGGAATGIGGCIRDVMGTGLAARPIANTNVFAVAHSDDGQAIPKGVIHPRRILQQVVAGVRDYGNRMGIPTINGAVVFHRDYLANPLVFAGCIGLMPLDKCFGDARDGDRIIALGGATGRDGIHGATFSSAELTDTHADEFSHAVQIGNAITQKKTLDVILQARDHAQGCLFSAITDCGAGGFSSAVGEMGEKVGATVTLDTAPLKYDGLSYTEIWISEAQERMVLAVPQEHVEMLRALCVAEDVSFCDLGQFGCYAPGADDDTSERVPTLVLTYRGEEVGRLSMVLLHDGIPMPLREATWSAGGSTGGAAQKTGSFAAPATRGEDAAAGVMGFPSQRGDIGQTLHDLLAHPDIASKHWIVRQYDHEVQGASVTKPLAGPHQDGPSDASVIRPKLGSDRGLAIGCGLAPYLSESSTAYGYARDGDSYWMALAAIDEAVRNVVCAGADPQHIAILDNFCWPSCSDADQMGTLVRAAEACYDGAMAYRTPFVSGKDSLNNQFTTDDGRLIAIPQTLLITALGIVPDVMCCRTMDAKAAGNVLLMVGTTTHYTGGSHYRILGGHTGDAGIPHVDLHVGPANARAVAALLAGGHVQSAHDCSEGGLLVAAAEMAFAGRVGLDLDLASLPRDGEFDTLAACFAETPSRYLLEVKPADLDAVIRSLREADVAFGQVGIFADHDRLTLRTAGEGRLLDESLASLLESWRRPLDW